MGTTLSEVIVVLKITASNVASESGEEEAVVSIKDAVKSVFPAAWVVEILEIP
jgi:hypothetical protein